MLIHHRTYARWLWKGKVLSALDQVRIATFYVNHQLARIVEIVSLIASSSMLHIIILFFILLYMSVHLRFDVEVWAPSSHFFPSYSYVAYVPQLLRGGTLYNSSLLFFCSYLLVLHNYNRWTQHILHLPHSAHCFVYNQHFVISVIYCCVTLLQYFVWVLVM